MAFNPAMLAGLAPLFQRLLGSGAPAPPQIQPTPPQAFGIGQGFENNAPSQFSLDIEESMKGPQNFSIQDALGGAVPGVDVAAESAAPAGLPGSGGGFGNALNMANMGAQLTSSLAPKPPPPPRPMNFGANARISQTQPTSLRFTLEDLLRGRRGR